MESLTIYDLNKDTAGIYKNCFDTNGSPKKIENIEWQFFNNTEANAVVDIAVDPEKNKAAAIYAVSCVRFKIGSQTIAGTQSLDTITDVDYRGKGLFINLAKSVYKKAADQGIALVYGFPNGNSIHGFEKKLDWTVLDPVPFLIKPLQSKYFTDKIKSLRFLPNIGLYFSSYKADKNFRISESRNFPEAVNQVWEKFAIHFEVAVERKADYLDWRYIQKPNENYQIAHCYDAKNNYCGFVVYVIKDKHNGKVGYIMELIFDPGRPKAAEQLLDYAVAQIAKQKADCILSWCLEHSPNYKAFKQNGFFGLPEKFRPIELHFGARAFAQNHAAMINKRENWYLSYSDSDTV